MSEGLHALRRANPRAQAGFEESVGAAGADAPLRTAITVGPDGIVREIAATWRTWSYTVTYTGLGSTSAPTAPKDAARS